MHYVLVSQRSSTEYSQETNGNVLFNGESPTNEFSADHADKGVMSPGAFNVPADTVNSRAGLFTHGQRKTMRITEMRLKIAAGTTGWEISILRRDGSEFIVLSGTSTGDNFLSGEEDNLPSLSFGEKIKLTSTGAPSGPSSCSIWAISE